MEAAGVGAPAPRRSVGRRLAGLFHGRPRLQAGRFLPRRWGGWSSATSARWSCSGLGLLGPGRAEQPGRGDDPRALRHDLHGGRLPRDLAADDRRGGRGDGHGRPAGLPDRVLHGEVRASSHQEPDGRRGSAASVVRLSREGLRVAHDPGRGRAAELVAEPAGDRRSRLRALRRLPRDELHLAPLHDHPDLRGARTDSRFAAQRVGRPRGPSWTHSAAWSCRSRFRRSSPDRSSRSR